MAIKAGGKGAAAEAGKRERAHLQRGSLKARSCSLLHTPRQYQTRQFLLFHPSTEPSSLLAPPQLLSPKNDEARLSVYLKGCRLASPQFPGPALAPGGETSAEVPGAASSLTLSAIAEVKRGRLTPTLQTSGAATGFVPTRTKMGRRHMKKEKCERQVSGGSSFGRKGPCV
ncbi:hypothetical protein VTK73DRAFT_9173 [Phialemonium thermophilum]|uniref:Uncharacterized protein n=1 Tax=Phialemonium thermophilum TaxID=223376 RepID=A0ABR3W3Z9_9PEZI